MAVLKCNVDAVRIETFCEATKVNLFKIKTLFKCITLTPKEVERFGLFGSYYLDVKNRFSHVLPSVGIYKM